MGNDCEIREKIKASQASMFTQQHLGTTYRNAVFCAVRAEMLKVGQMEQQVSCETVASQ
jgi:hypothetical protein